MDGKDITRPIGVNPGEDARRHSSISSPDSTGAWIATLAIGVPPSARTLVDVESVERESISAHDRLPDKPECEPKIPKDESQPLETIQLSSGAGVQAAEQGLASVAARAQLQAHHLSHPSSDSAPKYEQNCSQTKSVDGSIVMNAVNASAHPMVQNNPRAPPGLIRPQEGTNDMAQSPVRQDVDNPSGRDENAPAQGGLSTQYHDALTQPLPPSHDPPHTQEPSPSKSQSQSKHQSSMATLWGMEATQLVDTIDRYRRLRRLRRQYKHLRVTDLNLLRDPEPSYMRRSFREEIEAENGGIRPDDLLLTSPPPVLRCFRIGCDKTFDDDDERWDHLELDHEYPEDWICWRCRNAYGSRLEKRVHDLYRHSDEFYSERDDRSSKGLEN
ncbi:hypothetical protein AbraIFM66950_001642 [Aspergillus brasiliensis]|nr:hypothetical protein AbraIFM66950_001642 [Aspergillus brasiliensis]